MNAWDKTPMYIYICKKKKGKKVETSLVLYLLIMKIRDSSREVFNIFERSGLQGNYRTGGARHRTHCCDSLSFHHHRTVRGCKRRMRRRAKCRADRCWQDRSDAIEIVKLLVKSSRGVSAFALGTQEGGKASVLRQPC